MVNSVPDRIRRIREWRDAMRDQTHPGGLVNSTHWHDVNLLLRQVDDLEAIVRDLADGPAPPSYDEETCWFCDASAEASTDRHDGECTWRRAREWVDRHSNPGATG